MKNRCASILIVLILQTVFRLLHTLALTNNSKFEISLYSVIIIIILPIIYGFSSFFLINKMSKGLLTNYLSFLIVGFVLTFCINTSMFKEWEWFFMQTPVLMISYLMAHVTVSLDSVGKKVITIVSFILVNVIIALIMYYIIFITISQNNGVVINI